MAQAKMEFEILEDGTITVRTEGVPGEHHKSADEFLDEVAALAGGQRVTTKKGPKAHHHHHQHDHQEQGH